MPNHQPRTSWDLDRFYCTYAGKFMRTCKEKYDSQWLAMTPVQKATIVHAFIFEKFTLDPSGRCMLPGPGQKPKKRNDAAWPDFWLSDEELDEVVTQVMIAYEAHRPYEIA